MGLDYDTNAAKSVAPIGALFVAPDPNGGPVAPASTLHGVSTPIAGITSATPGVWTLAGAASASRKSLTIQNNGNAPIAVFSGSSAPANNAAGEFNVQPGQTYSALDQQNLYVSSTGASTPYSGASQ